jgi:hypothetical protein
VKVKKNGSAETHKRPSLHAIVSQVVCVCTHDTDTRGAYSFDRSVYGSEKDLLSGRLTRDVSTCLWAEPRRQLGE